MAFARIAVLGPGLLGGSVGLAVKARGLGEVRFWGRSEEKLAVIRETGFHASTDMADVVSGCDLVILATPIDFYEDLARQLADIGGDWLVTDVGSVKGSVHEGAGRVLTESGIPFVGSHPMAGSEKAGFSAARSDLFEGACCFLTNDEGVAPPLVEQLAGFWQSLGCVVEKSEARHHDEIVARVSHLPHVLAAVTARVGLRNDGEGRFGAGGLRDTTRVAAGDPAMWRGILLENREAVLQEIISAENDLRALREALAGMDSNSVESWLGDGAEKRLKLGRLDG